MHDFYQAVIKFLIRTILKAVLAAGVAVVLMGLLTLDGVHIGWWSAYACSSARFSSTTGRSRRHRPALSRRPGTGARYVAGPTASSTTPLDPADPAT
ncbi:hypothetical protein [Amycolatopsis magusensis]|uniref:hypothetical protein n=1 Tax=Amycolatopsis magusensis TaxID=882444 RepID=UPI00379E5E7B